MSNRGHANSKAFIVRLAVILLLGGAAVAYVKLRGSPLSLTEAQAARMIDAHELVGLDVDDACMKLAHKSCGTMNGRVEMDFQGWVGESIVLDVRDGKVTAANWKKNAPPLED